MPITDSVLDVALPYLEGLGSPFALGVSLLLKNQQEMDLAELSVDPRRYLKASDYALDAAAAAFLKKAAFIRPNGLDRRAVALAKWHDGEVSCFRANERLCRYLPENRLSDDRDDRISSFLEEVRKIILSWIGPSPNHLTVGRHGPGSTFSDKGVYTTAPDKMSSVPTLTREAVWFLPQWLGTQWGAAVASHHGKLSVVPGNRYLTVPKNALTDRSIAVEPSINVFYQLGLGQELRNRLKKTTGWDLGRAQEIHRQVACESSASREFATLDLSNASDTVSTTLVKLLMPPAWFSMLSSLRSPKTLVDGKWRVLEKFSSMGNGYTFELETILFAAVSCAVSRQQGELGVLGVDTFVYGDDIIVKDEVAGVLSSVLQFLGLTVNREKSFAGGVPFRESCGGDFFNGAAVRPFYMKEDPHGPQDYLPLANGIRALQTRHRDLGVRVSSRPWFAVLDRLPERVRRCRGPEALGDIVIHDDEQRWTVRWHNHRGEQEGIRYVRALLPDRVRVVGWQHFRPDVVLASATLGIGDGAKGVTPRDAVLSYRLGWVPYS